MAKPTSPRHSKTNKKPVTIDLSVKDVRRVKPALAAEESKAATPLPDAEPVGDFDNASSAEKKTAEASMRPVGSKAAVSPKSGKPIPEPDSALKDKIKTAQPSISSQDKPKAAAASINSSEKKMNSTLPPVNHGKSNSSSSLVAGISGGVIALAGAAAFHWFGLFPFAPPAQDEASNPVLGLAQTVQKLQGQMVQTEQTLAGLRNSSAASSDVQILERLEKAEREAQQAIQAAQEASKTIAALQGQAGTSPAIAPDQASIDQLTQRIGELEQALSKAQAQAQSVASNAAMDKDTLEEVANKLSSLQERLEEQAGQPDMAAIVAANALKSAIDRGGSYGSELKTYLALNTQSSQQVESLQALAVNGIPTYAQLVSQFPAVADEMIRFENRPAADAGLWDHLVASAKSMIRARPVGNVEGADTGAITARIEEALKAEQPELALKEWQNLPVDVQNEGQVFHQALVARQNADSLLATIIAQSLQPDSTMTAPEKPAATPSAE